MIIIIVIIILIPYLIQGQATVQGLRAARGDAGRWRGRAAERLHAQRRDQRLREKPGPGGK